MTSFYEELRKNDVISDEKENEQTRKNIDKWIFRLFLFLIGFMPLVVLANVEEVVSPLISNIDTLSSGIKGDLFTHYKALLLVLTTLITSALLLAKVLFMGGTIRKTRLNYVLGVFVVVIIGSTIASPNITIALNGQFNRSDGAISWLCYIGLMFIAMNIEYPKNVVRYIMYTMMPFVYINLYIITTNFYGKDLMQQTWVQKLVSIVLPEGASISEGSQLVGTLNQWNYMSGMFAMMTIMYLAWAIMSKKWIEVILGTITASMASAVMFMSTSTSGFLTTLLVFFVLLIIIMRLDNKAKSLVSVFIFLIISTSIFHLLCEKDERVWTESFGFFINENPYKDEVVSLLKNKNLVYANEQILELPELPERAFAAGSGRLYIWEKIVDLIENRPLRGYGADSVVYNFQHYNIDARSAMWDENNIVDKPHSMYIGVLYGFGFLGFLCLIVIVGVLIINSVKFIIKKNWSSLLLMLVSVAYFLQATFNDSLPGVSVLPWIFMGIGLALFLNSKKEGFVNESNA